MSIRATIKTLLLFVLVVFCMAAPAALSYAQTSTIVPHAFTQNHHLYDKDEDIRTLQKFLNAQGFTIASSGSGALGNETTFFGILTYRALIKFQSAQGLPATGYFGPLTRAAIAILTSTNGGGTSSGASTSGSSSTSTSTPTCTAPVGLSCYPGTNIVRPITPGNGYTPGFGAGSSPTANTTPPNVSAITATAVSTSSETITWTTDSASNSSVQYGKTTAHASTTSNASFVTSHSITLIGLTATTTYHFIVVSTDAQGNTSISSDQTFITNAYDYYVDPLSGSDTNNGSASAPFLTFTPLTSMGTVPDGTRIGVRYRSGVTMFTSLVLNGNNLLVESYGATPDPTTGNGMPYIDARDVIPAVNWTLTAGQTAVYQAVVTLPNNVKALGNAWENENFLTQTTSIANVASTPGTFYMASWTAATSTIYVQASDSSNVATNGLAYRYSSRLWAIALSGNSNTVRGFRTRGNAHQDGTIALYGTGNTLDSNRMEDGARHNALAGGNVIATSNYFYRARNDLESGTGSMFVVNQADLTTSTYTDNNSTYDGGNLSGQSISAFDSHDGVGERIPTGVHNNPIFANGINGPGDDAVSGTINNPVLNNAGTFFTPSNSGHTTTINNLTGTIAGSGRLLNTSSGTCGTTFNGGSVTVAQIGAGVINATQTNADCNITVQNMSLTFQGKGGSSFIIFNIARGTLTFTGNTMLPTLANYFATAFKVGIGATGAIAANNNTYPYGINWILNGSSYSTLSAWNLASSQDSTSAYGSVTQTFADNFTRANSNLSASPGSTWTKIDGVDTATQVSSNQLITLAQNETIRATQCNATADMWVQTTIATTTTAGGFGAAQVQDVNNIAGLKWIPSQYQIHTMVAGVDSQKATGGTPTIGDVVMLAMRGDIGVVYINKALMSTPVTLVRSALTSTYAGISVRGSAANPESSAWSCGPVQ